MESIEKRILLIDEIKNLYSEQANGQNALKLEKEEAFSKFCYELQNLYNSEKEKIYNEYVRPFVDEYPFLEETSSLQVLKKPYHETYHSLFLKYIWDSQNSFGSEILKTFLNIIGQEEKWFDTLCQRTYNVYEEKPTKELKKGDDKKRIDLLFVDDRHGWCIVIENKIHSEVHYSGSRSQLDYYYKFCEKKYRGYDKLYILLSLNGNNISHIKGKWIYADYYQVFKSLLKYHTEDLLIKDYLKTLFKILFPNAETMDYYKGGSLYQGMQFYKNIISNIK